MRTLLRLLLLLPFWANLAQAQTLSLRAITYNIHHDDTGSNRIAGVIFNAGAQLVGIQEVPNAAAADAIASRLTTLTGKTWTARMMPTGIEGDAITSTSTGWDRSAPAFRPPSRFRNRCHVPGSGRRSASPRGSWRSGSRSPSPSCRRWSGARITGSRRFAGTSRRSGGSQEIWAVINGRRIKLAES